MNYDERIKSAVQDYFEAKNFDDWDRVKSAMGDANGNLYFGPMEDQEMGFEEAVDFLGEWASGFVEELYYDEQFDSVSEFRPNDFVECFECNGTGLPDDADEDEEECFVCHGEGEVENTEWEFIYVIPANDVKRYLFGKELAKYIL